jgi:hypothetical protein
MCCGLAGKGAQRSVVDVGWIKLTEIASYYRERRNLLTSDFKG